VNSQSSTVAGILTEDAPRVRADAFFVKTPAAQIMEIARALNGWRPTPCHDPLRLRFHREDRRSAACRSHCHPYCPAAPGSRPIKRIHSGIVIRPTIDVPSTTAMRSRAPHNASPSRWKHSEAWLWQHDDRFNSRSRQCFAEQ